jgi:hypothetical protein
MRSEAYRRLHEVCREMALQSHSENLQDRWLKMAEAWLDRANDANNTGALGTISLGLDRHGRHLIHPVGPISRGPVL